MVCVNLVRIGRTEKGVRTALVVTEVERTRHCYLEPGLGENK